MYVLRLALIAILLIALHATTGHARKKDKPKTVFKSANVIDIKLNVVLFLSGGIVIGEAAEYIEDFGGDMTDKSLYGFGLSVTYYPKSRYGFTANLERAFKELPNDAPAGRGWFYSGGIIYNLASARRAIPYLRFDFGWVSASYPKTGPDQDLGTYTFIRPGLGLFMFTGGRLNWRLELYYKRAFAEEEYHIMAECVGAELGIGIPFVTR